MRRMCGERTSSLANEKEASVRGGEGGVSCCAWGVSAGPVGEAGHLSAYGEHRWHLSGLVQARGVPPCSWVRHGVMH